jgi:hypothetical protein
MQNKTQKKPDLNLQRHENVPIYRTARELLMGTRQVVSRMDKIFKYDMGADLTNGAKRLLRWAFLTYEEQDNLRLKLAYLRKVRVAAQDLMIDHRVANEITSIPPDVYAAQVERIVSVFTQSETWRDSIIERLKRSGAGQSVPTGTECRHLDPQHPRG